MALPTAAQSFENAVHTRQRQRQHQHHTHVRNARRAQMCDAVIDRFPERCREGVGIHCTQTHKHTHTQSERLLHTDELGQCTQHTRSNESVLVGLGECARGAGGRERGEGGREMRVHTSKQQYQKPKAQQIGSIQSTHKTKIQHVDADADANVWGRSNITLSTVA